MTCNQCCYSSVGRFDGVVRLHCGLVGCSLPELPASCDMGRRFDAGAEEYSFWFENEAEGSRYLLQPLPR